MDIGAADYRKREACAACKFHRRRCNSDCLLAPHFPKSSSREFLNAYRLFGVANMTKILQSLPTPQKQRVAMECMKYEANVRARYPVHGCLQIINDLCVKIQDCRFELHCVHQQIAQHRESDNLAGSDFQAMIPHNIIVEAYQWFHQQGSSLSGSDYCSQLISADPSISSSEAHDFLFGYQVISRAMQALLISNEAHGQGLDTLHSGSGQVEMEAGSSSLVQLGVQGHPSLDVSEEPAPLLDVSQEPEPLLDDEYGQRDPVTYDPSLVDVSTEEENLVQ